MSNVVRIKNPTENSRSIRPYIDRGELVTLKPGEIASLDLKKCGFDVKTNPRRYFTNLGFIYDPAPEPAPKILVERVPEVIEPEKDADVVTDKTTQSASIQADVGIKADKVKISIANGDVKHFHPGNKTWHVVKVIKEWAIGRVIYNETDKKYFKVLSLDGDLLVGVPMTDADALKATGVAP